MHKWMIFCIFNNICNYYFTLVYLWFSLFILSQIYIHSFLHFFLSLSCFISLSFVLFFSYTLPLPLPVLIYKFLSASSPPSTSPSPPSALSSAGWALPRCDLFPPLACICKHIIVNNIHLLPASIRIRFRIRIRTTKLSMQILCARKKNRLHFHYIQTHILITT